MVESYELLEKKQNEKKQKMSSRKGGIHDAWRAKCFLTYSCLALAMRGVFVNFTALLTRNAVAKTLCIR